MAKVAISEVEVLRFFETEPLDKATVLFNIVADKMQGRLNGTDLQPPTTRARRRSRIGEIPSAASADQNPAE